jgi:hypothetical protein
MFRQDPGAPALERFYEEVIDRLFGAPEHYELHTDVGSYEESLQNGVPLSPGEWGKLAIGTTILFKPKGGEIEDRCKILRDKFDNWGAKTKIYFRAHSEKNDRIEDIYYEDGVWYLDEPVEHHELHTDVSGYDEARIVKTELDPDQWETGLFRFQRPITETLDSGVAEIGTLRFYNFVVSFKKRTGTAEEKTTPEDIRIAFGLEFKWATRKKGLVYLHGDLDNLLKSNWEIMPYWHKEGEDKHGFVYFSGEQNAGWRSRMLWLEPGYEVRTEIVRLLDKYLAEYGEEMFGEIKAQSPLIAKFLPVEHHELHTDISGYDESRVNENDIPDLPVDPEDWAKAAKCWASKGYRISGDGERFLKGLGGNVVFSVWYRPRGVISTAVYSITRDEPWSDVQTIFTSKKICQDAEYVWARLETVGDIEPINDRYWYNEYREAWLAKYEEFVACFRPPEHYEIHTDISGYDESVAATALSTDYPSFDLSGFEERDWPEAIAAWEERGHRAYAHANYVYFILETPDSHVTFIVSPNLLSLDLSVYSRAKVETVPLERVPADGEAAWQVLTARFMDAEAHAYYTRFKESFGKAYEEWLRLLKPVEHYEVHTDIGAYDEAIMRSLKEVREVLVNSQAVEEAVVWAKERFGSYVFVDAAGARRAVYFQFCDPDEIGLTLKTKPAASVKFQFDRLPNREEHLQSIIVNYKTPRYAPVPGAFPSAELGIIDIVEGYPIPETWEELEKEIVHKYSKTESKFIYKFRRLKFFPEIREAFEGFVERIFKPVEHYEVHTDVSGYDEARESL